MEVWCSCCDKKDASNSQIASCDALVLDRSMPGRDEIGTDNKPIFLVEKKSPKKPYQSLCIGEKKDTVDGIKVNITKEKGQQQALQAIGSVKWILAYATNDLEGSDNSPWLMIPAENLIGAATQSGTKIAFVVERAQDVMGLSLALQQGVDALCVESDASQELWEAVWKAKDQRVKQQANSQPISEQATDAHVVSGSCWRMALPSSSSSSSVVADRICIDFVRSLTTTEGCWIGSSAKIMALVLSEAATSSFVPSRPFRVNAGPVHAYVCLGDGSKTKYLCELQAGDEVLVYDAATESSRSVAVGRLKMEVRPCVLVGLQEQNNGNVKDQVVQNGQIFLQQAETVRLGQVGGFVRVTDLEVASPEEADKRQPLLLRVTSTGTHVGGRYDGKVDEK